MARLQLTPIGNEINPTKPPFWAELNLKDDNLDQKRNEVKEGWGQKYQDRVHQKGKQTTHERIARLADSPSLVFPIGTFVNDGEILGRKRTSFPSRRSRHRICQNQRTLERRHCQRQHRCVRFLVASNAREIIRAQKIALKLRIPVVYLVDCSGLFLPEQSKTFPGATGLATFLK